MPHTELIIDGEKWPSVTEVGAVLSKPFLLYWYGKVGTQEAERIKSQTAAFGRNVHEMVETFLTTGDVSRKEYTEQETDTFSQWWTWWTEQKTYTVSACEQKVKSTKYKYHGTFDALLQTKSTYEPVLTDWKFSNSDDHYRYLQLAGYAQAYHEEHGVKLQKGLIVRIGKDGLKLTEVNNLQKYVPAFLAARKLWDFVNQKGDFAREQRPRSGHKSKISRV